MFLGQGAISANATSTVALLPGAMASLIGYGKEVAGHRSWLRILLLPSLVGGAIGSILLLRTPETVFARLAPILVLFATVLFVLQGYLARRAERRSPATPGAPGQVPAPTNAAGAWFLQFLIAIYGGYFGAGIGILMLAVLGFMGIRNIFAMNGLKNLFGFCINGVAATYFIVRGAVVWPLALIMMGGAIAGGYGGARLAQRIGKEKARTAVVVIGLLVTALLFWQQMHN
jgi:uncharacterized membrane protein YfcA